MFEALEGDVTADPVTPPRVVFHAASGIEESAVAQVRAEVHTRILRTFAGRGLIERFVAREMLAYLRSLSAGARLGLALTCAAVTASCYGDAMLLSRA